MKKEAFYKRFSLRTKLTISYTLSLFVLLGLALALAYLVLLNILYKGDYQFLQDEFDDIVYLIQENPINTKALKETILDDPIASQNKLYNYFSSVVINGQIFLETPGIATIISKFNIKTPRKSPYFTWIQSNKKRYLIICGKLKAKGQVAEIKIALDITNQHKIIQDRNTLLLIAFVGTLLAGLVGFLIADRGARILEQLTEATETITASSLNQRINPEHWPKELRRLGIAFNNMLARIETSFNKLQQFSADLAHELRTPLTNLITQTEVTLSSNQKDPDYVSILESNLEEFHKLTKLIEYILFLARAENPHLQLDKIQIVIEEEIQKIIEYYLPLAEDKDINIKLQGVGKIHFQKEMFQVLISNLLANAIKYARPKTAVTFDIKTSADNVQISCQDEGMGISTEHLPYIFNRFYRTDEARQTEGLGLGLAIAKSIVELHQGHITMQSRLNVGSKMIIQFPL